MVLLPVEVGRVKHSHHTCGSKGARSSHTGHLSFMLLSIQPQPIIHIGAL